MGRPRARRFVSLAPVAVALIAGAAVVWSVSTFTSLSDARHVAVPGTTSAPPVTPYTTPPATAAELASSRIPPPAPVSAQRLVVAAEDAAGPGLSLGVAVLDLHTGELALGRDGGRKFMSASLSKLVLVVDVLDRHRAEGRPLDPADRDLIGRALSASDDGAMNVLWGKHDGAGAIARVAGRLGLAAYLPAGSSELWGDTVVTAADMVKIYQHVLRTMPPQDGAVIVGALTGVHAVAADGFGQHYGLLRDGASPRHYAKQAWVPYDPAGYLLHSAGVVHDGRTGHAYAVALLSIQPYSSEQAARDRLSTIAAAATAQVT